MPYNLLKYQLLDSIIFPSRFEGNSITLLESFYFSNKSVKIFCSDIPQFKEQLQNLDITSFFELNSNNLYKTVNRYKNKCICGRKCNIQLIVDTYSNVLSNFII